MKFEYDGSYEIEGELEMWLMRLDWLFELTMVCL